MAMKPETKKKMGEAMRAESDNPALFKELVAEFMEMFQTADANKDGRLDLKEYKAYVNLYYAAS